MKPDELKTYLLNHKEDLNLDYKLIYEDLDKNKYELAMDMACFAHQNGGKIIVGIKNNSHKMTGLDISSRKDIRKKNFLGINLNTNEEQIEATLRNKLNEYVSSRVSFTVDKIITSESSCVLIINVDQYNGLIGVRKNRQSSYEFKKRVGREKCPMDIGEIISRSDNQRHISEIEELTSYYLKHARKVASTLRFTLKCCYGYNHVTSDGLHTEKDGNVPLDLFGNYKIGIISAASLDRYSEELSSRAFLSMDIHSKLKPLLMELADALVEVCKPGSLFKLGLEHERPNLEGKNYLDLHTHSTAKYLIDRTRFYIGVCDKICNFEAH